MRSKNGPIVRTKSGTFKVDLPDDHRKILTNLIEELRTSLTNSNDDAALRRLFPTAYHNDPKKDAEYQRLMRDELLESRLAAIDTAIKVLTQENEITAEEIDAFSRSINSLRLVIGTALDIAESDYEKQNNSQHNGASNEDSSDGESDDDDGQSVQKELYEYLGWLLEWTVSAQSSGL